MVNSIRDLEKSLIKVGKKSKLVLSAACDLHAIEAVVLAREK